MFAGPQDAQSSTLWLCLPKLLSLAPAQGVWERGKLLSEERGRGKEGFGEQGGRRSPEAGGVWALWAPLILRVCENWT